MKKKLLSFVLMVCTILALLPGVSITASAVDTITDEIIQERINELDRLLSGKYFTVNGQGCCKWNSNHGCSNCNVNNIIRTQWFENMFGTVRTSQLFLSGGKSCMGFVEFAEWYIFRSNNSDTVLRSSNVKYSNGFNYNTISENAEIGDYIRVNGHSFILVSVDSSGVEVLDCNSYSTYNCIVSRHRIEFSNKNYAGKTIYISKMYSKAAGFPVRGSSQSPSTPVPQDPPISDGTGHWEYRYVGYETSNGGHECWCETYLKNKFGSANLRYSEWSTMRHSPNGSSWTCGSGCSGNHTGIASYGNNGAPYWSEYTLPDGKNYYWEETRWVEDTEPQKTFIITLDDGSTCSQITVTNGSAYGSLPTPTKDGYTFDGWYTQASGGSKITSSTTVSLSSDQTLYAHWTANGIVLEPPKESHNCQHSFVFNYSEIAHPHNNHYTCSICGATKIDGNTWSRDCDECWGPWSEWSTDPVSRSDTREVQTRTVTEQIKISSGSTEYRYGGYATSDGRHECWCETYLRNKFGSANLRYSDWSTTRYSVNGSNWTCGNCNGSHTHVDHYGSDGRAWWPEYTLPNGQNYYWEEIRTTDDQYETIEITQYRYRDKIYD